ncbi:START domain-containing protein [Tanacetum coccineum]|uniref:START domain-containing protein n=1 Tax=Tanacetum coccineum TaxID=301880 RepID=A0ABQ5BM38_9ASTR
MTRATPQQRAYLENVYQNTDWPIRRDTIEPLVNIVQLNASWIRRWFYRRHRKDLGITWFLPQQQQQQQQPQPQPQPPPPQQPPVVAQIVGSTGGQQSQIPVQIVIQPQQLNDDPPVLTLEMLENFFDDPPDDVNNGRDVLIPSEYESRFPRPIINQSNIEASRDRHAYHMMDYKELAAMLMEVVIGNWSALFPFNGSKERDYQISLYFDPYLMGPLNLVTIVEHMGVSEINRGGIGFGAKVMLDLLERSCERRKFQTSICSTENHRLKHEVGGVLEPIKSYF